MPIRKRGNRLERWEIQPIKAMIAEGRWPNDQDILAYFTRPSRSINHRAIGEIRTRAKHAAVKAAGREELDSFLATWPNCSSSLLSSDGHISFMLGSSTKALITAT